MSRLQIDDNPKEHRYEALVDDKLAGFIQYRLQDERVTMVHTEVEPAHEGQGVGSELAKAALEDARERGLKVVPLCPFIARYVRRQPELYLDLVPESLREKVLAGSGHAEPEN
jgi:predicted GNAT family acetyltransferase